MRTTAVLASVFLLAPSVLASGFHIFDRYSSWTWYEQGECPGRKTSCNPMRSFHQQDDVWFVPSNQFHCGTLQNLVSRNVQAIFSLSLADRKQNYRASTSWSAKPHTTSDIGHGTVIRGFCGSNSLTLYPINNGRELEVWETGGSRMYGKCYRQDPGKTMSCDGTGCGGNPTAGPAIDGTCKVRGTDVWVCPVSLC